MKKICFVLCSFFWSMFYAQRDSIFISAELMNENQLKVKQKIVYHNPLQKSISKIKLLNWASSYQNKKTALAKRKLEERNTKFHFAKKHQLGWVSDLEIVSESEKVVYSDSHQENIYVQLSSPLEGGQAKTIYLTYTLYLPEAQFTGYGRASEDIYLKYFFIVPDSFEDENQSPKNYLDLEETQNVGSFWDIQVKALDSYFVQSNLELIEKGHFRGQINTDLELHLSLKESKTITTPIEGENIEIVFAYPIDNDYLGSMEFYLPLHLKFIKDKIGFLPKKILITPKEREKMSFLGNEDVRLGSRRLALFSTAEKVDLDYFSILSHNILEEVFKSNKNTDHWLKNGLKTYLEIQYLKKFYKEHPLLGEFKDISFLGMKILKWSNASRLKLIDRYGVAYHYMMSQNLDQAIGEEYENLSVENQVFASQFEMGALLDFVSNKEGAGYFDNFIKSYLSENKGKYTSVIGFLDKLSDNFGQSYDFLKDFLYKKQRIDFRLNSVRELENNKYEVRIGKNTLKSIPFSLKVESSNGEEKKYWLDTPNGQYEGVYTLDVNQPKKIVINPNYSFPEQNFRNNFSEKAWFGFSKKVKFKLFTDIPNPEFNEVYINPDLRYNAYDALLFGLNFRNSGLLSQPFSYSVTPYISIGEWKLTGTAGVSYKIQPVDSFFKTLVLGVSGTYFHYNYDLSYRKTSLFSVLEFNQNPRSLINTNLRLAYQYIDRDMPKNADLTKTYAYYGLWNLGLNFRDKNPIHEKFISANYQLMRDFQKFSLEGIYYWQFSPKKQIQFRIYGGVFLKNNAKNRAFDFGISRINDYNFAYSLLGQSAISGVFSQEYIMAEGGFRSYVGGSANQWILAVNTDIPIWKMLGLYGDVGGYRNRNFPTRFVWDSGVKVGLIPNVLEFYFPVQSSLGFEPSFNNYHKRIRFSLNLDLNSLMRAVRKIRK